VGERPVVETTVIGGCWEVVERIVAREVVQTVVPSSVKGRRSEPENLGAPRARSEEGSGRSRRRRRRRTNRCRR
jgi:hypothetical protein